MSDELLLSAEEIAQRLPVSVSFIKRRMGSGRWPSVKLGHSRYMTEAQLLEALAIETTAARPLPSGLSPRTRHRPQRKETA